MFGEEGQRDLQYDSNTYEFSLVEEKDLSSAANLSMLCFYNTRIKLNTEGMVGIEKFIWNGVIGAFNKLDKMDAMNAHYIGFKSRSNHRLRNPGVHLSADSILIAMSDKTNEQLVGVVEVCLEAADGKLAPAVAMNVPWRGGGLKPTHQPYLCNLCIDTNRRRQGLGLVLCQLAEKIVLKYWGKETMYLHVEEDNVAAQRLYSKMGYELGPQLPSWERSLHGLDNILYYKKTLAPASKGSRGRSSMEESLGVSEGFFDANRKSAATN
jgi:ribosomal protein S18 acetylase RimI-like enzyme